MSGKKTFKDLESGERLPCVTLIGMPGSGKSTIAALLAQKSGWAFMDTDLLLESLYACRLQDIVDSMRRDEFLDAEEQMILSLKANRCVIATGGSVVYRPEAMSRLSELGLIVYVETGLECLKDRIALNPQRGISIAEGQSLEDLFLERRGLYSRYADFTVNSELLRADECAELILEKMRGLKGGGKAFHD